MQHRDKSYKNPNSPLETNALTSVGGVLQPVAGRINLRSFDAGFLSGFFPMRFVASSFQAGRLFSYSNTEGERSLREVIAKGAELAPDDVVITDGASQALYLTLLAGLPAGARVLVPRPVFPAYLRIVAYRGCSFEFYDWSACGVDLLRQLELAPPAAVIINSPNNPTGVVLNEAVYDRVLRIVRAPILVVLDDTYTWLEPPVGRTTRFRAVVGSGLPDKLVVAIGSLGKLLCMPGLRLGFVATEDARLRNAIIEAKRHLVHSSCPASENLASKLMRSSRWWSGRSQLLKSLDARRADFVRVAARLGATSPVTAHGFYAYALHADNLNRAGVDGVPGSVFEASAREARYCLAGADSDWAKFLSLAPT